MTSDDATPLWPRGFHGYTGHGGIRDSGDDISIIVSDRPAVSAAVFTRSRTAGPAVLYSRRHAPDQHTRAVVTLAQNANVATGREGERNAEEVAARTASAVGAEPGQVLIGSTGVIGRKLPMDTIRAHFDTLAGGHSPAPAYPDGFDADPLAVATAMMTTDTRPKTATATVGGARITAVAKGVGMLEPNMATMLAYLTTDAGLSAADLDAALRSAVDRTFNRLSIDTDTSTSDTVCVIANGAAGPVDPAAFADALYGVCLDLTHQLARDGEGATKLLTVHVGDARDDAQALGVAKAVLNSPLVKTAVHGADPNWGRVVMAVGKCVDLLDDSFDPDRLTVAFAGLEVFPAEPGDEELAELVEILKRDEVRIDVTLATGTAEATVYGCDLSAGYVRINADYTT